MILKISTSISEAAYGDPLLNTWILAWDVHKITEFDFSGFFNANIFYPHKNTIAYSEHMIGSAIFALPIIVFFKNSILAYNIILLMGFSLSGFGMYLLSYYLTGNKPASFCAGVIFAFFPWRFGQIGHLQAQVAQWIPLTFLYLHKFVNDGKNKHLLLFTLFFILQFLSNGYYAMFLSFFVGLIFIMEIYKIGLINKLRAMFSYDSKHKEGFYLLVLVLSVLFSLGPIIHFHNTKITYGPYLLLYKFFPGFDGLRVPARFIIMVALAVSIFAAFGVVRILECVKGYREKVVITCIITVLILLESAPTIPLPISSIAVGNEIPDIYKWLGSEKGDFAILELPLPKEPIDVMMETKYVYYSIYHWKRLVNGYSGYFPPAYDFLYQEGMKGFPKNSSIGLIKELDVKYVIIHSADYSQTEWEAIKSGLQNYESVLRPFKQFGEAYVYEIINNEGTVQTVNKGKEVPRGKWVVKANTGKPEFAIDDDIKTRWTRGRPMLPSDFFKIDLGESRTISKILLELGTDFRDYPRGYKIELSKDDRVWEEIKREDLAIPPIRSCAEHPKRVEFEISISPSIGRYIRITQTGSHPDYYWSIREIRLFE